MAEGIQFDFKLTGAEGLAKRLREFAPKLQKKALGKAARKAMAPVRAAVRANAETIDDPDTGTAIWKLVTIRAGRMREPGVMMRVGIIGGAISSKQRVPPWYWRLIELGTETQRARPFMRPALENNAESVAQIFVTETSKAIDKLDGVL